MVKEVKKEKKTYYRCTICKFNYESKQLAQQCEAYCEKFKSCSLEITKHAVEVE